MFFIWGKMLGKNLDSLEKRLIHLLAQNGRISVAQMATQVGATAPTIRSRIGSLIRSGILRVVGLVNPTKLEGLTMAIVGICLEKSELLDERVEQISNLRYVYWAAVVTGHFDIIVEVLLPNGMPGLYQFLTEDLPKLGDIRSSESFVVMKAKRKWILLPEDEEV